VGASVGVGVYPADGEDFETLLHSADLSMYARKADARR
jgi:predicted signal transduction protein with EAL and GGDEF domain